MSQEADLQAPPKKKEDKPGRVHLQNVVPLIDCWAVMDTPLDFSFMKLTSPAGRQSLEMYNRPLLISSHTFQLLHIVIHYLQH